MKAATVKRVGLPQWHVLAIAGEARLDHRTVYRALEGSSHGSQAKNIRQQVIDAAARLNIALPPLPSLDGIDAQPTRARST